MDDRNAQVGWTEAQWNRIREEVLQAWQRVRVAGSFLPVYGPLPPSTQVVPSEVLKANGSVDDRATAALIEIDLRVTLSRQQIWEEDLSSALLQFRRRATQLGQLEDWFIFNGAYPSIKPLPGDRRARNAFAQEEEAGHPGYRPALAHLDNLDLSGTPRPIAGLSQDHQIERMRQRNPGSLGLVQAPRVERANKLRLDNDGLMDAVVGAINSLENNGYVAPYVCVFGRNPFEAAFQSIKDSTVLPRDRIEPLIGRELLHASGIDILPPTSNAYNVVAEEWQSRGVLLSIANEPIDLALAAEATPEFRQVNEKGRYVFSVFERFALRIKDADAIVPLIFETPAEAEVRKAAAAAAAPPAGP